MNISLVKSLVVDDNVWPHFNRASFDQDKLVSYGDHQYGLYWAVDETLVLFRRDLRDESIQTLRLPYTLTINPKDGHRNTVVGISPKDGRLHLSWDHHNNDLRYTKSHAGYLFEPPDTIGEADFEPAQPLVPDAPQRVTYPRFFNNADDELFFIYRTGSSGDGDSVISRYHADAATWEILSTCLFSKEGVYPPWENSDSRNAYLHDVLFDRTNRLHITWVYRETAKSPASNHDLHYAWSDDEGLTWCNNAGAQIARPAEQDPIALDDPGIVVREIPVYAWLMNQCGMTIDHQNRPHVVTFHMEDTWKPEPLVHNPPAEVYDRFHAYHYWRDEDGTWRSSGPIVDPERSVERQGRLRRANIVVDQNDNVIIYHATDEGYRCHASSAASGYTDWTTTAITESVVTSSDASKHDRRLLRERDILSFTAEKIDESGQVSFVLLDFKLD